MSDFEQDGGRNHLLIHLESCREEKQGVKQLHFEKCKWMKLLSTLPSATSPKNKK
jgi:hypothetical protein